MPVTSVLVIVTSKSSYFIILLMPNTSAIFVFRNSCTSSTILQFMRYYKHPDILKPFNFGFILWSAGIVKSTI